MTATVHTLKPLCTRCGTRDAVKRHRKSGGYLCYRCNEPIGELPLEKDQPPLSDEYIETAHATLLRSDEPLQWLINHRRLTLEVIKKYRLGFEDGRVVIPIPGKDGKVVNTKGAAPGTALHGLRGRSVQLFPGPVEPGPLAVICEGEWDCLVARSLGFNAYTSTGGAAVFHSAWAKRLVEAPVAEVAVVYDVDQPGRVGARTCAERLLEAGLAPEALKVIHLPIQTPAKDLTDWVRTGAGADDLTRIIQEAPTWRGQLGAPAPRPEPEDVTLREACSAEMAWKWTRFDATILSLAVDSYQLPKSVEISCTQDWDAKKCGLCMMPRLYHMNPQKDGKPCAPNVGIDVTSPDFLTFLGCAEEKLHQRVLGAVGVPVKCPRVSMVYTEAVMAQEGRISDTFRLDAERQPVEALAIFVGDDSAVEANAEYSLTAVAMPHPRDQILTHVVHSVKGLDTVLTGYKENRSVLAPLRTRKRKLAPQVDAVLEDAERVTRIYGRPDLHLLVLLSLMSTLRLTYEEQVMRGWLDVAVVGDTSQGKSETIKALHAHTGGHGEVVALKDSTTRAGLFGGMVQDRGRLLLSWGLIPRLDGRWAGLDEVNGSPMTLIQALTNVRSEGVAEVHMAGVQRKTNARTRLLWSANPRDKRQVRDHTHGIEVLMGVFGKPEDVRRLDAALVVASGEVPPEVFKGRKREAPTVLTEAVARELKLRAWSQRGVAVDGIMDAAAAAAAWLAARYVSNPPLLEPADLRWKICRLAVALANLLAQKPGKAHVEYIQAWLDRIYSSSACGFLAMSEAIRAQETLADPAQVRRIIEGTGSQQDVVTLFLQQHEWGPQDFADLSPNGSRDLGDQMRAILVRNRAMVREGRRYVRTPAFVDFLKGVQQGAKT